MGQFQVCDPMFKRELRLERFDYEILATRVGRSGVDLTYDRGLIFNGHAPAKVDIMLMVLNGNGIDPAEGEQFDRDNYKNLALRIVRPFGKTRIGLFGYSGREREPGSEGAGTTNAMTYWGPDVVMDLGEKWAVSLEYLERRDDDPRFVGDESPTYRTRGGFAEVHYFPQGQDGRWVLSALYNKITSDFEPADPEDADPDYESASLTMNYLLARNLRGIFEVGRDLQEDRTRVSFGLSTAF